MSIKIKPNDVFYIVYESVCKDPLQPEWYGFRYRGKTTVKGEDPFTSDNGYRGSYGNKELHQAIRQCQRNWGSKWKEYFPRTTLCAHKKESYAFQSEAKAVDFKFLMEDKVWNKYRGGSGGIYGKKNPLRGRKLTQEHKDNISIGKRVDHYRAIKVKTYLGTFNSARDAALAHGTTHPVILRKVRDDRYKSFKLVA